MRRYGSAAVLLVILAGCPVTAFAQAGWYLIPSVRLSEVFDDNVFVTPSPQQWDFITRLVPRLQGGYRSDPLTLLVDFASVVEVYARHPDLNNAGEQKHAGLTFEYLPTRRAKFGLTAGYTETLTPSILIPDTGVEIGRQSAKGFSAGSSFSYQFTPGMSGSAVYAYTRNLLSTGPTNQTHDTRLSLTSQLTPVDSGTLIYHFDLFDSEGLSGSTSSTASAVLAGWTRQLTRSSTLTLRAGPQFAGGTVGAEAFADSRYEFESATASLTYSLSRGLLIGETGTVTTNTLSASVSFEPLRSLSVTVTPGISRVTSDANAFQEIKTYRLVAAASYPLARWLTGTVGYQFAFQEQGSHHLRHGMLSISLDVVYPIRVQ